MSSKTYVVFGAYGGVGSEVVQKLRASGAEVVAVGRDQARLESLSAATGARYVVGDATVATQVQSAVDATLQVAEETGAPFSGAVNCVGSLLLKPAHLTKEEEWGHTIATNLTSSFLILKASVQSLRQSSGSLVFTSSAAASIGLANHEAIAAAKAGIEGLVRSAAASYGAKGVRINAVSPGLTETPLTSHITASDSARNFSLAMHPLGRLGTAQDIASAMFWLLSDEASWVTGQIVGVDGGLGTLKA